jgi:hypothetical protein
MADPIVLRFPRPATPTAEEFQATRKRLLAELPRKRLFVLFDNSKNAMRADFMRKYGDRVILHTEAQCKELNPQQENLWKNVEGPLIVMLRFLRSNFPAFTHAWMIEHDIYCGGSWARALRLADGKGEDLLATKVSPWTRQLRDWWWWDALRGRMRDAVPLKARHKCFFPLVRLSRAMLECVEENVGRSTGYCEVYIPTLAHSAGLTLDNLPPEMLGKWEHTVQLRASELPLLRRDNRLHHKFVM